MKLKLLLFTLLFIFGINSVFSTIVLHPNGVTITCDFATPGTTEVYNNETYYIAGNTTYIKSHINGSIDGSSFTGNYPANRICTSHVTKMNPNGATSGGIFYGELNFNQNISNWDVSQVTDMESMFYRATKFNQDISHWDVSKVTNMYTMFAYAYDFNSNISSWDVGQVTDMGFMFDYNYNFNSDISSWDVSQVTRMTGMFYGASDFNSDIRNWNVSKVEFMDYMFFYTNSFNQDIHYWCTPLILSEPYSFGNNSLNPSYYPIWGTCPSIKPFQNTTINCDFGGGLTTCNNFVFNGSLNSISIDCNANVGIDNNVTVSLYNQEDNNYFFNETITSKTGEYFTYSPFYLINDSGTFKIEYTCRDDLGNSRDLVYVDFVPFGTFNISLISPNINSSYYNGTPFNFTSKVECIGGECGDVEFTIDPKKEKNNFNLFELFSANKNYFGCFEK